LIMFNLTIMLGLREIFSNMYLLLFRCRNHRQPNYLISHGARGALAIVRKSYSPLIFTLDAMQLPESGGRLQITMKSELGEESFERRQWCSYYLFLWCNAVAWGWREIVDNDEIWAWGWEFRESSMVFLFIPHSFLSGRALMWSASFLLDGGGGPFIC
jgi:hypothetical protein